MNDLELIRSFRADVRAPDDERMAGARSTLLAAVASGSAPAPPRRVLTRPRLTALVSLPALAAVAAMVILATVGGGSADSAGAAIIRHARAAMTAPADAILHTEVISSQGFGAYTYELTSSPYSYLAAKGQVGASEREEAGDGTTGSYYDPTTNTIHEMPSAGRLTFDDPLAQIRQALRDGRARWIGTAQVDGVATYKIQLAGKDGFSSDSLVAYVDRHTYRPIALDDPQSDGSIVRLRVVAFEYLPATASNLGLLRLTDRHPTARVVMDPASAKDQPAGGK
jgi:hypothetical protein